MSESSAAEFQLIVWVAWVWDVLGIGCDGNLVESSGSTLWNTFSRQVEFCSIRKSSFVQQFVIVRSLPEKRRKITKKKKKKWYLCFGRVAAAAEGDTLST